MSMDLMHQSSETAAKLYAKAHSTDICNPFTHIHMSQEAMPFGAKEIRFCK